MERSELLVRYGFIKEDQKDKYYYNEKKGWFEPVEGYKLDKKDAYEEEEEFVPHNYTPSGFPVPLKRYRLLYERFDLSLEEPYYWVLDSLKEMFPTIEKLEDSFAAAENSAFFGVTQQRLGAQQDKVSQYLATMGKMIKELFQMVRELRIIDERLAYYDGAEAQLKKPADLRGKSEEITLKGLFVDLVQGGGKSAASVYGMARELEFVTLPDLFFDAPPFKNSEEIERHIVNLAKNFNRNVLRVLQRHLAQYTEWRVRTHQEHKSRQRFMLQYLRQHYEIIKMYLNWVKPYLRHVAKLTMKEKNLDSADIVSAFESSMLDIEILGREKGKGGNACVLVTFNYRTRPELKVVQEGYQRGPVHVGRMMMTIRGYTWTDKQLENYRKLKDKEAFFLIGEVSASIKDAMESLGEELELYLKKAQGEAEENKGEIEGQRQAKKSLTEKLLGDFYTPKKEKIFFGKPKEEAADLKSLEAGVRNKCWNTYHFFKKAHGMIAW